MKSIVFPAFVVFICASFASCHNYEREKAHNAAGADSTKMDSANHANAINEERTAYKQRLQTRIDSLQAKLNREDSTYSSNPPKAPKNWERKKKHIEARIGRLKDRQARANTISAEKWMDFKKDVDTAMLNIRDEWQYGE